MATSPDKIQWIIDYFKFDLVVNSEVELGSGYTANDYLIVRWYENDFGMLMVKIVNIEINTQLIAKFIVPDNRNEFNCVMHLLKINYNG